MVYISLNFFHLNYYLRTNSQESNYCYKTCKNSNDSKYALLNYNPKAQGNTQYPDLNRCLIND